MRKPTIIIGAILICLVLLWVWFYFWKSGNESNFDKYKQCLDLADSVKKHFDSELWETEFWIIEVSNVTTRYNKKMDTCLADVSIDVNLYVEAPHQSFTQYNLYDVLNWYKILEQCTSPDWCVSEYKEKLNDYK